ncbi:DUF2844 domain-containing protein [Aquella oligotrophica]|uniref:DUF2844 domain-containing protein n=1 Tax=Aquella oligotrophica TaxID=2067065 RepID=A0A2I7N941_9NEIS|nr:DUF2844 domain-containing protein [Aquella oligotrophica]AUR52755.1 hypothetical protein CUN60_10755 [Aquella oligotrophica]
MRYKYLIGLAGILLSSFSYATLGENPDSINKDIQVLNTTSSGSQSLSSAKTITVSKAQLKQQANYDQYSFITDDGITVTQYVANGNVFATKWHGSHIPNLRQLYGAYFPAYQTSKSAYMGTSQHKVTTTIFDAGVTGIVGAFSGYALLKAELPANLTLDDLK